MPLGTGLYPGLLPRIGGENLNVTGSGPAGEGGAKDAMAACARAAKRFTQICVDFVWTLCEHSVTFYPRVLKKVPVPNLMIIPLIELQISPAFT